MDIQEIMSKVGRLIELKQHIQNKKLTYDEAYAYQVEIAHIRYLIEVQVGELNDLVISQVPPNTQKKQLKDLKINLDPRIRSQSITKSLQKPLQRYAAFSPLDYQPYLLVFLLLKGNSKKKKINKIIEVIDEFKKHYENKSFTFIDIHRTDSGATRCNTNLRFTIDKLRELGMLDSENNLTIMGFFAAWSLVSSGEDFLNAKMEHSNIEGIGGLNRLIFNAMEKLGLHDFEKIYKELSPLSHVNRQICDDIMQGCEDFMGIVKLIKEELAWAKTEVGSFNAAYSQKMIEINSLVVKATSFKDFLSKYEAKK